MIKVVPYNVGHAYEVLNKNVKDFDMQLSKLKDWEAWTKDWGTSGPAYSLFIDNEIIGCAGVMLLGFSRGECWMLVSSSLRKYRKTVFKVVKENLDMIIKKYDLKRVQTLVLADFEEGKRFVEHLGFEVEGLMKSYGPQGEDFLMYGRI